jgi:hypothetical protein
MEQARNKVFSIEGQVILYRKSLDSTCVFYCMIFCLKRILQNFDEPVRMHAFPTERNYIFSLDYSMHCEDSGKANG